MEEHQFCAILGPTNTGKTHRALERMLEHSTGMIGVPLRLLAREIYDKLTVRLGEQRVALVTGEEKRVPKRPSYWVCTVEAMPRISVDFLAVDEIQLAANAQRGHVFTDRLLNWRGRLETWVLGAETIRPLLIDLVPNINILRYPRLSKLTGSGSLNLGKIPKRSAIVAFSTNQVFELGEQIRRLRGGAAIVLGVLSPRARNAQVAMFQSGEVDFLVATDAIGMGLNLDVDHVVFAALNKFDGQEIRPLDVAELAQIAGRAGRHTRDGTFATLAPLRLASPTTQSIERHRFSSLSLLRWRNSFLDFSSISALLASLRQRSPHSALRLDDQSDDLKALAIFASSPHIKNMVTLPSDVELLWRVCSIPDYRKLLFESHISLLEEIFMQLRHGEGHLTDDWLHTQLAPLSDTRGDIDTLTFRLTSIRTWNFVANQRDWVQNSAHWQAFTRDVEDQLSDALHQALLARFVEKRQREHTQKTRMQHVNPNHPFAQLSQLSIPTAVSSDGAHESIHEIVEAPFEAFRLNPDGTLCFRDQYLGSLVRGQSILLPDVRLNVQSSYAQGERVRLQRRLTALARDYVEQLCGDLRQLAQDCSPAGRGLAYQLEQGLGLVSLTQAREQLRHLTETERASFESISLHWGTLFVFAKKMFQRHFSDLRAALCAAFYARNKHFEVPAWGTVSVVLPDVECRDALRVLGYIAVGKRAVRIDIIDQVAHSLSTTEMNEEQLSRRLACPKRDVPLMRETIESMLRTVRG